MAALHVFSPTLNRTIIQSVLQRHLFKRALVHLRVNSKKQTATSPRAKDRVLVGLPLTICCFLRLSDSLFFLSFFFRTRSCCLGWRKRSWLSRLEGRKRFRIRSLRIIIWLGQDLEMLPSCQTAQNMNSSSYSHLFHRKTARQGLNGTN